MVESKAWNWELANRRKWLEPCEESYYFVHKWHRKGRKRVLDLGCGLGRHAMLFARAGFEVTATDLSELGIATLKEQAEAEDLHIDTVVCDMTELPFEDDSFDCVWAYHVISHTDTEGVEKIMRQMRRILRPGGAVYLSLCSKDTWSFRDAPGERIDANTVIREDEGPEKGIPHYYADLNDIFWLFSGFCIRHVKHVDDCYVEGRTQKSKHYYIEATLDDKCLGV